MLVAIVVVARPFESREKSPEWLFAHNSAEARFADDGGELTLTLVDPDPQILAFTDRPDRVATTLPLADLVGGWQQMFGTDAPRTIVGATMLIDSATANDDNYTIDYSLDGDYARFNLGTEDQPELADAGCYAWLPQSPENCVQ